MQFSYRDIANLLDLEFHIGDKLFMKELLFDEDDNILSFRGRVKGRPQFLMMVQDVHPNVDIAELAKDYNINTRLIRSNYFLVRDYHKRTSLYPNLIFRYEESNEPEMISLSQQFKILDGLVLPIDSQFWNFYLPPNHFEDNCTVRLTDKEATYHIPVLPKVDSRFITNRHKYFFDKPPFCKHEQMAATDLESNILEYDVHRLIIEAVKEVYGDEGVIYLKEKGFIKTQKE